MIDANGQLRAPFHARENDHDTHTAERADDGRGKATGEQLRQAAGAARPSLKAVNEPASPGATDRMNLQPAIPRSRETRRPLHWLAPRGRRINRGTLEPRARRPRLLMRQRHSSEPITLSLGTLIPDAGFVDTPLPHRTPHRGVVMKPRSPKTPGLLLAARCRLRDYQLPLWLILFAVTVQQQ